LGLQCDGSDSDLCEEGITSCIAGSLSCSDNTGSTLDLCDGVDNDCDPASADGSEDPGIGQACDGTDSDLCLEGTSFCAAGSLSCSDNTSSSLDVCDGADNDCDPASADGDEDPQVGLACDGADADLCNEGTLACGSGSLICSDNTGDNVELCNDADDDCDGIVDEEYLPGGSVSHTGLDGLIGFKGEQCGSGVCAGGVIACALDAISLSCDTEENATEELCNGMDDNCDGVIDEGCELP
jgi:hypothetical protein